MALPRRDRRLRPGLRAPRLRRPRLARQPPGRRRRARRSPRRPAPACVDPGRRAGAARRRHRRVGRTAPSTSDNGNGAFWIAGVGDRVGARHDPGGAGRRVGRRAAVGPAAADGEVRRPRRRAPPHPHGPGRRRGRRDGRGRRRPRHRQRQRREGRTRRPTPPQAPDGHRLRLLGARRAARRGGARPRRRVAADRGRDRQGRTGRRRSGVLRGPDEVGDEHGYTTRWCELPTDARGADVRPAGLRARGRRRRLAAELGLRATRTPRRSPTRPSPTGRPVVFTTSGRRRSRRRRCASETWRDGGEQPDARDRATRRGPAGAVGEPGAAPRRPAPILPDCARRRARPRRRHRQRCA